MDVTLVLCKTFFFFYLWFISSQNSGVNLGFSVFCYFSCTLDYNIITCGICNKFTLKGVNLTIKNKLLVAHCSKILSGTRERNQRKIFFH